MPYLFIHGLKELDTGFISAIVKNKKMLNVGKTLYFVHNQFRATIQHLNKNQNMFLILLYSTFHYQEQ